MSTWPTRRAGDPTRREVCPWRSAPSSALLCSGLTMLATTVNLPARRAPSPQIRARDTSLDGTTNGSAGINSAPNVDAGINGATHLGGQRCGDHEDRGDSTNYRKLAEHKIGPQQGRSPPPWRRRTNVWPRVTSPTRVAKRPRSEKANLDPLRCPMKPTIKIRFTEPQIALVMRAHPRIPQAGKQPISPVLVCQQQNRRIPPPPLPVQQQIGPKQWKGRAGTTSFRCERRGATDPTR
jgi:hypothetical protein